MKFLSLLILFSTLIFPKAWISYDLNWEMEGDGYSASADKGFVVSGNYLTFLIGRGSTRDSVIYVADQGSGTPKISIIMEE